MPVWIEPTVTFDLEVALDANPWDAAPVYTSVGAKVRRVRTFRGTTSINSEFGPAELQATLDSRDRLFDPRHAAGTYFGKLLPMKRVRFTITFAAVTYTLFTGWSQGWQQNVLSYDNTVTLTALDTTADALEATVDFDTALEQEIVGDSPVAYWPLQGSYEPRIGSVDRLTFTNDPIYTGGAGAQQSFIEEGTLPLAGTGGGGVTFSGAGKLWANDSTLTTLPTLIEAWVNVTANNAIWVGAAVNASTFMRFGVEANGNLIWWYSHLADNLSNPGGAATVVANIGIGLHHLVMVRSGSLIALAVDGSQIAGATTLTAGTYTTVHSQPGYMIFWNTPGGQGSVSDFATYNTNPVGLSRDHYAVGKYGYTGAAGGIYGYELGGARLNRILDAIGHQANLREISTGGTRQGAWQPQRQTAGDLIREVVRAEQGIFGYTVLGKAFFRDRQWLWTTADDKAVTFSDDNAAGAVVYDGGSPDSNNIRTVRNKVTTTWERGAITVSDTTSIDLNREHTETIDCPTIPDGAQAGDLSKYRLRIDKDPQSTIPTMTIPMRRQMATNIPKVCGLELADVVTVESTPLNVGAQAVARHQLLGIEHDFTPEDWHALTYFGPATPMADQVPYWTLGDATLGKIGAAFGNKIPF